MFLMGEVPLQGLYMASYDLLGVKYDLLATDGMLGGHAGVKKSLCLFLTFLPSLQPAPCFIQRE